MINFEEKLMELFIDKAKTWVAPSAARDQGIEIKCWQGKRIYVNIIYHVKFTFYINILSHDIYISPAKNEATRKALNNCVSFIEFNLNQFIERYRD